MNAHPRLDVRVQGRREARQANPSSQSRELMGRPFAGHKRAIILLPRKTSMAGCRATVPETDAGGQGEHPKALERTVIKELGKMIP